MQSVYSTTQTNRAHCYYSQIPSESGVAVPITVSSMGQVELFYVLHTWNYLTVCKQMINIKLDESIW